MPVILHCRRFHITRLSIDLSEFPDLLRGFFANNPQTQHIEELAAGLRRGGFDPIGSAAFLKNVGNWGGYSGIAGRVLKQNPLPQICSRLEAACGALDRGQIGTALQELVEVKGLGISFASKHLKFLAPEKAVVLDSIISTRLGFPMTIFGYEEFLQDCLSILTEVQATRIPYPGWGTQWRVSDIEMVFFTKLGR
jgi:hypothetical protein